DYYCSSYAGMQTFMF
nr:immunoglobulin light chain junction region [Macaca mulatta]MOX35495.1 immunoglobulin light chain junction region [Macaca mulatta]MOX37654.1 immunoglobulin light chain junction region [Macaca mulatta]